MRTRKKYQSVMDVVSDLSHDREFTESVAKQFAERRIITKLMALRSSKGISQGDIAARLNCTQSKVSKLETSDDSQMRISELRDYARALEYDVEIILLPKRLKVTDRIKLHAFAIRRCLKKLVSLARADDGTAKAIADFHGEAFFNLLKLVKDSSEELPKCPENGTPYIKISVLETDPSTGDCEINEDELLPV